MFSTIVEISSGAKIFPTVPLLYSNLIGVKSWAARADVSLVAGIKRSLGQKPLYSQISGSKSQCKDKIHYRAVCILKVSRLLLSAGFDIYLQHVYILVCGTDENFATDFKSGSCQTFLWQTSQEQCLILVHIRFTVIKMRSYKNNLIYYGVFFLIPQLEFNP